jgi:aerobic carbon-monoxide dehydrogenase large subunit
MPKYVGKSYQRKEDYRLLTGKANFVADMKRFNMAEVCFVRSTYAHAVIKKIHTEAAEAMDGVIAVLTAKDIEGEVNPLPTMKEFDLPQVLIDKINPRINPCPEEILARERVIYTGQLIAVVIARNRYLAEDAASLIKIDYEPLQVVTDPYESMKKGVPRIHSHIEGNVQAEFHLEIGDVESAFKNADHTLTARFSIPRVASSPMETRGVLASFNQQENRLEMWSATQVPYMVRNYLSKSLNITESNIRVIAPDVGGGFGPKANVYPEEIILGYIAMKFGRPVKWIEDRIEHLQCTRHARDQYHDVKVAIMNDGTITAIQDRFVLDSGANNPQVLVNVYNTAVHMRGVFKIENFDVEAKCVLTNKTPNFAYRGAGRPEAVFVMDRILYHVSSHLGIDPVEVLKKNIIKAEDMPYDTGLYYRDGAKAVYDSGNYPEGLKKALDMLDYENFRNEQKLLRQKGRNIGIGISSYIEGTGIGPYEGALVRLDLTGHIMVNVGSSPHGQGHETVFAQICADELGVTPEEITVRAGDTSLLPYGVGTFASRSAVVAGSAVQIAAQKLLDKLLTIASILLEVEKADLTYSHGKIYSRTTPDICLTFQEIAQNAKPGFQSRLPRNMEIGTEASHYFVPSTVTYSSGFHIAVVEVDKETGFIEIKRYIVVHDCGKVINPMIVDGQTQGGVAQGIGEAIYEEVKYDRSGQLLTGTFMDYLIPTSNEIPKVEMGHQEVLSPLNKAGIKGVGEGGAISPLGAIANAACDALSEYNVCFDELPVSPNRVFQQLMKAERLIESNK